MQKASTAKPPRMKEARRSEWGQGGVGLEGRRLAYSELLKKDTVCPFETWLFPPK